MYKTEKIANHAYTLVMANTYTYHPHSLRGTPFETAVYSRL